YATSIALGKPEREIIQDTWRKACFHRSDDEPHSVELPFAPDQDHRHGRKTPGNHDARDPAPRAKAIEQEIARHLEKHIADYEKAGAEPVGCVAERQIPLQFDLGEADIDAVKKGKQVADDNERHEPPGDSANDIFLG